MSLTAVIAEAVHLTQQATTENHTITTDVSPGAAQVLGDRDGVLQVLMNLLGNAVKYSSAVLATRRRGKTRGPKSYS